MSITIEMGDPAIRFDFMENKHQQKVLIDVLLRFSELSLGELACIIGANIEDCDGVSSGRKFFAPHISKNLGELFITHFS